VQNFNRLSPRYELKWVAGARGKPAINADIIAGGALQAIADPQFEILGAGPPATVNTDYSAEGGVLLTSTGGANDQVIILPHLDADQSAWNMVTWGTDRRVRWECMIQTTAGIAATTIWCGLKLTDTSVTATDLDQAFFRYQNGVATGNWQAVSSNNGVAEEFDTGVAVQVTTTYHLALAINNNRTVEFSVNGALVHTTAALRDAIDLIPYIGVEGNAQTLLVFGQTISRNFGA